MRAGNIHNKEGLHEENGQRTYLDSLKDYQGAFETNEYRNVFAELGYSPKDIDRKMEVAWNEIFYGDSETRIYYEVGEDEAYIYDVGSQDVRSEGMSYGMMMCVQMDKQKEFDRIWKWAISHMQVKEGWNKGYFIWSMHTDGTSNSYGPAPDGEEFFALALFFASHRWGDREEPFNYSEQARYILRQALHLEDHGEGHNLWEKNKLIKFVSSSTYTDPSYHLPHFYELFALWADEEDRKFWAEAAACSREFLKMVCHPVTGLTAEYTSYEGVPEPGNDKTHYAFFSDAYRVVGNIALDYSWFAKEEWEIAQCERLLSFFAAEGIKSYYSRYLVDGTREEGYDYQAGGLRSMNAMAALAATGENARNFAKEIWEMKPEKGQWRYYDDCLYFFSMLALSGRYRIWK